MVRVLLAQKGVSVQLGILRTNVGSFHIYSHHYDDALSWLLKANQNPDPRKDLVESAHKELLTAESPEQLIDGLKSMARIFK